MYEEEYEWIDVAHYDNMSYEQFAEMPVWYQEMMIAHYRTNNQREAVWAFAHKPKS